MSMPSSSNFEYLRHIGKNPRYPMTKADIFAEMDYSGHFNQAEHLYYFVYINFFAYIIQDALVFLQLCTSSAFLKRVQAYNDMDVRRSLAAMTLREALAQQQ